MAADLPVELKVRMLTPKPSTDEDEQTLHGTQEVPVRACAFPAVQEGLDKESAVIKFRRQLRESRWERHRQGMRSVGCNCVRTTELWEAGYGGAEQALWVAAQEDKMVEQYSQIVRLAGVQNTVESVVEMPNAEESVLEKPSTEESVQERPCAVEFVPNEHGDHVTGRPVTASGRTSSQPWTHWRRRRKAPRKTPAPQRARCGQATQEMARPEFEVKRQGVEKNIKGSV